MKINECSDLAGIKLETAVAAEKYASRGRTLAEISVHPRRPPTRLSLSLRCLSRAGCRREARRVGSGSKVVGRREPGQGRGGKLVISGCEYSSVVKLGPVLTITRESVGSRA